MEKETATGNEVLATENPENNQPENGGKKGKKSKSGKIIDIVSYVLIGIVALFAIFMLVTSLTSRANDGVPSFFGYYTFHVDSDSMEPDIKVGDLVFAKAVSTADIKEGDVISFKVIKKLGEESKIVTHKVRAVILDGNSVKYETYGINNEFYDQDPEAPDGFGAINPGDVLGKYTGRIPVLGYVFQFLQSALGFGLIIVLPCGLFFGYRLFVLIKLLVGMNKEKKKSEQEKTDDLIKEAEELRRKLAELEAKDSGKSPQK